MYFLQAQTTVNDPRTGETYWAVLTRDPNGTELAVFAHEMLDCPYQAPDRGRWRVVCGVWVDGRTANGVWYPGHVSNPTIAWEEIPHAH